MSRQFKHVSGFLTFTTDFGTRDHYVGAMKGVVAMVSPGVRVRDITHQVPSFDISEGAFAIAQAYPYYPPGTVHVVVVDPGVGSSRRAIAALAAGHLFVAPDNGVLSHVLESVEQFTARRIAARHGLPALSRTFHGRDLFAPLGARLAGGLAFDEVGPEVSDVTLLPAPAEGGGRVLHVDGFGNLVTSFRQRDLADGAGLRIRGTRIDLRAESYATVPAGRLFLIVGSSGYVEISLNRESAADALQVRAGEEIALERRAYPDVGEADQSARETV